MIIFAVGALGKITLPPSEGDRANKLQNDRDRAPFTASRSSLGQLKSGYVENGPAETSSSFDQYSKPSILINTLQLNPHHTRRLTLLAVGHGSSIDVEVEGGLHTANEELIAGRTLPCGATSWAGPAQGQDGFRTNHDQAEVAEAYLKMPSPGLCPNATNSDRNRAVKYNFKDAQFCSVALAAERDSFAPHSCILR